MVRGSVTWEVRDGRALWDGRTLAEWAGLLVDELVEAFDPVEVWLFGSLARAEDDGDSDIDILVILDRYDPAEAIELKQQASRSSSVPAPFDVAFTDPRRMEQRRRIAGSLERAASSEGQSVYQRG